MNKNTFIELSQEEEYYLSCLIGHVNPKGNIARSLSRKFDMEELDCEDWDKIIFNVAIENNQATVEIEFNEEKLGE